MTCFRYYVLNFGKSYSLEEPIGWTFAFVSALTLGNLLLYRS